MKILYVEHSSVLGGGQRSLLDLLSALDHEVARTLACPAGPLAERANAAGERCIAISPALLSFRLHPLRTPAGLAELVRANGDVRSAAVYERPDLIHANSVRAGLAALDAARRSRRPLVVHLRDRLPNSALGRAVVGLLVRRAARVVCISRHVAELPLAVGGEQRVRVIANPIDLRRFDPSRESREQARAALRLAPTDPILAVVAQITPWKGQLEAIEAVALARAHFPRLRLLIVGSAKYLTAGVSYDNAAYLRRLEAVVRERRLEDAIQFMGEREDIPRIMRAADIVLAPSWQEPFGRTVIEAMAMGTAVIATANGGPAETIETGVDGLLIAPRDPSGWAGGITSLLAEPLRRERIAAAGARSVRARYASERHAAQMLALYRELA